MPTTGIAKLFMHGRSQAVRLPKEFRLTGKEVRVRRIGRAILLEPLDFDAKAWTEQLDRYHVVPFMEPEHETAAAMAEPDPALPAGE